MVNLSLNVKSISTTYLSIAGMTTVSPGQIRLRPLYICAVQNQVESQTELLAWLTQARMAITADILGLLSIAIHNNFSSAAYYLETNQTTEKTITAGGKPQPKLGLGDASPSPEVELLEKIAPFVVDDDEGGEVLDLDPPHGLHAEFGIFVHVDTSDAVLRKARAGSADRAEKPPCLGSGLAHLKLRRRRASARLRCGA
jgi:hypothetical protein